MSHMTKMLIACLLPFLLIFLLPVFGISGDWTLWAFLIVFFVAHLWMMRGHDHAAGEHEEHEHGRRPSDKGDHQHG